jgi:hypothetical protein
MTRDSTERQGARREADSIRRRHGNDIRASLEDSVLRGDQWLSLSSCPVAGSSEIMRELDGGGRTSVTSLPLLAP